MQNEKLDSIENGKMKSDPVVVPFIDKINHLDRDEKLEPEVDGRWRIIIETLKTLSVEPAGALLVISLVVSHLIFQNLMMETICRVDLGYPEDQCKEIINKVNETYKVEERQIQKVAAGIQAFTSVIFCGLTVLVVLFVGPWSDANGRKIPLLLSVTGLVLFNGVMLICYSLLGKVSATILTLVAILPTSLTGGVVVFAMSAYSHISDTTSKKNRTVRTGILSASVRSGTPIGFALGGTLTRVGVKITTSLFISIGLSLVALLIVVFRVKNIKPNGSNEDYAEDKDDTDDNVNPNKSKKNKRSKWIRYNPIMKLWQALAILFKKRKDRGRFWLLILCYICYAAPGSGEHSMVYYFVRERLQWNVSDFGFFSMYNWFMSAVGVVLAMFILSKKLKISDPVVGFIAGISQIGGSTIYAFTTTVFMMYLASGIDLLNGTMGVVSRSMLSKTVEPNEAGKLFGLLGVLDSLLPLAMIPTYALTYRSTNTVFAGAFFLLSVALTIPAELIFMYFMCRKDKTDNHKLKVNGKVHTNIRTEENLIESGMANSRI